MPLAKPLRPLRDRIRPSPRVLFVGINPGIRSAETGHHFAGYSNRFWRLLYDAGLVPEQLTFERDVDLLRWGFGITNLIARPTPGIGALRPEECEAGRRRLLRKVARVRPAVVAFVGVTLYRAVFIEAGQLRRESAPLARVVRLGRQAQTVHGAHVFVLPNPSGRNANFSY